MRVPQPYNATYQQIVKVYLRVHVYKGIIQIQLKQGSLDNSGWQLSQQSLRFIQSNVTQSKGTMSCIYLA